MKEVQIPGGTAVLCTKSSELTARKRRPIELLGTRIGRKVEQVATATRLICEGDVVLDQSDVKDEASGELKFPGGDVEVSTRELALIMDLNDAIALSLLKAWTLDRPLPANVDEYLDLPVEVFDALRKEAAVINAEMQTAGDGFSPDAVEDPASPTGG
jgi:hypothetical protein